jgi:hypothetical protein
MTQAILILSAIVLLGGVMHIGLGLSRGLTLDHLWFTSAGLALMLIAFINYLALTIPAWSAPVFLVVLLTNLLGMIFLGLLLFFLRAPHVALLFLLLVAETILTIWSYSQMM